MRLNMSKYEVAQVMGEPGQAKGSNINKQGKIHEVWEYSFENPLTGAGKVYRFTFVDDRLIKWGK